LGVLHLQQGRPEKAEPLLARAVALAPGNAAAWHDRGAALRALDRLDQALDCFNRSIALNPNSPPVHYNRGTVLLRMADNDGAIASFTAAIARDPNSAPAYNERANALRALNRLAEAVVDYDRAAALQPNHPAILCNRGFALQDLGRFDEALDSYNRAIAVKPDYYLAHRSRGTLWLLQGRWREGFADFEWRLRAPASLPDPQLQPIPYWAGDDLRDKSIVVYSDGAFGDLVQFCRFLPMVVAKGARVTLLAPDRFHKILNASSLGVRVVSSAEQAGHADFRCELMSLPFLLKTELNTVPAPLDHLACKPARTGQLRDALPKGSFNVGICWQGNPARHIDRGRSIPLAEFAPLAQVPGVRLISLQKHHGLDQLQSLPNGMHVESLGETFDDGPDAFVDAAAVMRNLDLVVTSDTAIAHLAAALGRPTWIALRLVPEWRWLLDRSDSPWYPSVRLFRQKKLDDWKPVFQEIAGAIEKLTARDPA
jgi:Flp pilus assembly protein TadD